MGVIKLAQNAGSETVLEGLGKAGGAAGFGTEAPSVTTIIAGLLNAILAVTGVVFLIMIVYAGIMYVMSGGEEEKVKKAKRLLTYSLIGIVLIASSYAISLFVFQALGTALGGTGTP